MSPSERPEVPRELAARVHLIVSALPETYQEDAWVGVRWRVGGATVAHLFGGEDQLFRLTLRGQPSDVAAFENLGEPYFRAGWGTNVIGMIIDADTDWDEVAELLIESYCIMAPGHLVESLGLPPQQ